jgi:toxin YhaV
MSSAFAEIYMKLAREVERLQLDDPAAWRSHPKAKIFAAVNELMFEIIPANPNDARFQQGNTLGHKHRHWRRAKFMQRFRMFFRFDSATRVIIFAWLNDENTLRKAGSKTDPYAVFRQRLHRGDPPDDWQDLLRDAGHTPTL